MSVSDVLQNHISGSVRKIWAFRDGRWSYYSTIDQSGSLNEVFPGESYWLYMEGTGTLHTDLSGATLTELRISSPGWVLGSFSQDSVLNLALQVLTPFRVDLNHSLENVGRVWAYDGSQWSSFGSESGGNLTTLEAGAGSWFHIRDQSQRVTLQNPLILTPTISVNPIQWTRSTGPPGGGIWSLSVAPSNPQVIYAPSHDLNILKSENGGDLWYQVGERELGAHIFAPILIDPLNASSFLVSNGSIHRSTDGGASFMDLDIGSGENRGVVAMAYAPSDHERIYAAMETGNIYRSNDRGASFVLVQTMTVWEPQNFLLIDPFNRDKLLLVVQEPEASSYHLVISEDAGSNFSILHTANSRIFDIVIHPQEVSKFYFTTDDAFYRTLDGGQNFTSSEGGGILAIPDKNPALLYRLSHEGEFSVSSDDGFSFSMRAELDFHDHGEDHHGGLDMAVDPQNSNRIYIGRQSGFYRSIDGGSTFNDINNGLVDDGTFTLAVDPSDSDHVLVGNFWSRGVFKTTDAGVNFELLEEWRHAPKPDHYPMEIVFDPSDPGQIYITGEYGLKKSIDGGATWNSLGGSALFGAHFHGLAIDPVNPLRIYAGTGKGEDNALAGAHIYRSTDGGASFEDLTSGFPSQIEANVYVIAVAPSNPSVVYVGTNAHVFVDAELPTEALGIYYSSDGGNNWEARSSGLPSLSCFSLAVNPENPNHVLTGLGHAHAHIHIDEAHEDEGHTAQEEHGSGKGLYESTDGGLSWSQVSSLPAEEVSHIEFHPINPNIIMVSYGENRSGGGGGLPKGFGLYLTMDGGRHWIQTASSFTAREKVVMDVVLSSDGERIYVGTDDGFYRGDWNRD